MNSDTVPILNLHNQDEGNYALNSRNFVISGKLVSDQTNFYLVTPVFSFAQIIAYKIFGVHIWSTRLPSSFFAILTILTWFLFLTKYRGSRYTAAVFALLLGSDFLYLIHNRIGIPESTQIFFYSLALILLMLKNKNPYKTNAFVGFLSSLAILAKTSAASILGIKILDSFIDLLIMNKKIKGQSIKIYKIFLKFIFFFIGLGIPIVLWWILIVNPHMEEYLIIKKNVLDMHRPYIRGALIHWWFWKGEIIEFIQGGEGNVWKYIFLPFVLAVIQIIITIKNKSIVKNKVILYASVWLISGLAYFLIINYKPARWFVINLIPMYILASLFITNLKNRKLAYCLIFLIVGYNLFFDIKYIFAKPNYSIKNASVELTTIVGGETVVGESLLHLENNKSKVYSTYFMEGEFPHAKLNEYLSYLGNPKYFVTDSNLKNYIDSNKKYKFIKTIISNQYFEKPRIVYIYNYLP